KTHPLLRPAVSAHTGGRDQLRVTRAGIVDAGGSPTQAAAWVIATLAGHRGVDSGTGGDAQCAYVGGTAFPLARLRAPAIGGTPDRLMISSCAFSVDRPAGRVGRSGRQLVWRLHHSRLLRVGGPTL